MTPQTNNNFNPINKQQSVNASSSLETALKRPKSAVFTAPSAKTSLASAKKRNFAMPAAMASAVGRIKSAISHPNTTKRRQNKKENKLELQENLYIKTL